jgi:uroporphyrinogen-III synthase
MTGRRANVAVFRPDDDRLADAVALLASLGATPVADPMLAVEPTGAAPREDADYAVLTSKTGAELAADAGWEPGDAAVCAIGERTAESLHEHGYEVDVVPDEFSSRGLVAALSGRMDGARVEVARSDHGTPELLDGLAAAGGYVHETVLYGLVQPEGAGDSTETAARGDLDGALFTSSLTVEHFLDAAAERGVRDEAVDGLRETVVGAIGEPTRETAEDHGIGVDVVPDEARFAALATEVVEAVAPTYHE